MALNLPPLSAAYTFELEPMKTVQREVKIWNIVRKGNVICGSLVWRDDGFTVHIGKQSRAFKHDGTGSSHSRALAYAAGIIDVLDSLGV